MLDLIKLMVICCFVLLITFVVLIALPQSKLREALKPWIIGILCLGYVLCPIDFMPEIALGPVGLLDDAGVLVAAFASIRSAFRQRTAIGG